MKATLKVDHDYIELAISAKTKYGGSFIMYPSESLRTFLRSPSALVKSICRQVFSDVQHSAACGLLCACSI